MSEKFRIEGRDERGEAVSIETMAEDHEDAVALGRGIGLSQVNVSKMAPRGRVRGKIDRDVFIRFNRELAGLADLGVPLPAGLRDLARGMSDPALEDSVRRVATDVEGGRPVAEAVRAQGAVFPAHYADLMEAAVASGDVGEMLRSFAGFSASMARLQGTLRRALFYPIVAIIASAFALSFVRFKLLPQFEVMFQEFDIELSRITLLQAMAIEVVTTTFYVIILAFIVFWTVHWMGRFVPELGHVWPTIAKCVPVLRNVYRYGALSRFFSGMSITLKQGLSMVQALSVGALAGGDRQVRAAAQRISDGVERGESFDAAASRERCIPNLALWMIELGRREDRAGDNALELARIYQARAEVAGQLFSMFVSLGAFFVAAAMVGLVVTSLFSPLVMLMNQMSG